MDEKFIGLYNEKEAQIISKNTACNNGLKDCKKEGFEQGIKENQISTVENLYKWV